MENWLVEYYIDDSKYEESKNFSLLTRGRFSSFLHVLCHYSQRRFSFQIKEHMSKVKGNSSFRQIA